MKTKILVPLLFFSLVHCTSMNPRTDQKAASGARSPSAVEGVSFESYLSTLGLNVYYANLHAHHFMDYRASKKSPHPPGFLGPGACEGLGSFPQDDGRPCRVGPTGENEFVVPPSAASGAVDKLDYFRMACDYGRASGGIDILMITPHSKNNQGEGDADTALKGYVERHNELSKINQEYGGTFYCGLGQEASSISKGNHVNIMGHMRNSNAGDTRPFFFPSGAFDRFYSEVKTRTTNKEQVILQFNHPDVMNDMWWGPIVADPNAKGVDKRFKERLNDYGIDDYGPIGCMIPGNTSKPDCTEESGNEVTTPALKKTFANIIAAGGSAYKLVEITDVAGATTNFAETFKTVHKRQAEFATTDLPDGLFAYIFFLNMGFKVGPTANQDNHFMNYGSAIASRTGVLAKSLAEDEVFNALNRRAVFATEDKNAKIILGTRVGGKDFVMGDDVAVEGEEIILATGYTDQDDAGPVDVKVYFYHESDQLSFNLKRDGKDAVRTIRFTDKGAELPIGPSDGSGLTDFLVSGQVKSIKVPLKKGMNTIFLEYTQGDLDKIWSAPLFIRSI